MSAPLRDYQHEGIRWLTRQLKTYKAALLADDPGLGKTRQALAAARNLGAESILVVCPAGARHVWDQEIVTWSPDWRSRVVIIEPGVKLSEIQPKLKNPKPLILIVAYDELSNTRSHFTAQLACRRWDLLVIDEAHYLKNPSNRTQALYGVRGAGEGLQAHAAKVILLTGTPTPNHAGELWQHYRTFWPRALTVGAGRPMTLPEFEHRFTRYRDTVFGRQVTGSKNTGVLREALKSVILRRRKDEVLKELPPLQLQDIPLTLGHTRDQLSMETRLLAQKLTLNLAGQPDDVVLRALRNPDGSVATLRREIGELKVQPAVRWIDERLASTTKILVFAWHHSVIEHLRRGLLEYDPVVVTGETSPLQRTQAIERFQRHSGTRVFIGQVLAAGTAITLTAASEVAIVEPSWVPGENVQAICRAHRLGQRDSVLASFLYLPGTLDQQIMRTFRRKAAEIAELQGDTYAGGTQADLRPGDHVRPGTVRQATAPGAGADPGAAPG